MKKSLMFQTLLLVLAAASLSAQEAAPSPTAPVTFVIIRKPDGHAVRVKYPILPPISINCQLADTIKVRNPRWLAGPGNSGNYVAHDNSVDMYGDQGKLIGAIPINHPMGIAIGEKALYVVEQGLQRISVFDHHGKPLVHWGSLGNAVGQFDNPAGIAVKDRRVRGEGGGWKWRARVYVADEGNHRVECFTEKGEPVTQWGSLGEEGHGTFDSPFAVAVDGAGTVLIADRATGLIQCFSPDGNWINQWDARQFSGLDTATGLAVVEVNGEHIVVTGANGKACVFGMNGLVQGVMDLREGEGHADGVSSNSHGLLFSDTSKGEVFIYSLTDLLFDDSDD